MKVTIWNGTDGCGLVRIKTTNTNTMGYINNVRHLMPEPKPEIESNLSWRDLGRVPVRLEQYRETVLKAIRRGWIKPGPPPLSDAAIKKLLKIRKDGGES